MKDLKDMFDYSEPQPEQQPKTYLQHLKRLEYYLQLQGTRSHIFPMEDLSELVQHIEDLEEERDELKADVERLEEQRDELESELENRDHE